MVDILRDTKMGLEARLIEKHLKGNPVKDYLIPLGSILVALVGVLSGVYAQYISSNATYEAATISAKQVGYAKVITALDSALYAKQEGTITNKHMDEIRERYYEIELLVPSPERNSNLELLEKAISFIRHFDVSDKNSTVEFTELRREVRMQLQRSLENDHTK
ncbi:MAG: hypothetical protein JRJ00_11455 [Deltaproteobacteria bacterium]|nr:hypothetical protein [Deltaproteobacteria bacterium]